MEATSKLVTINLPNVSFAVENFSRRSVLHYTINPTPALWAACYSKANIGLIGIWNSKDNRRLVLCGAELRDGVQPSPLTASKAAQVVLGLLHYRGLPDLLDSIGMTSEARRVRARWAKTDEAAERQADLILGS